MSAIRRGIKPLFGNKGVQTVLLYFKRYDLQENVRFYSDTVNHEKILWASITKQEWRKRLAPQEYAVTREKGTEPPFSGKYDKHFEEGIYKCICCSEELFSSNEKYDSGSGWPSFYSPIATKGRCNHSQVTTKIDISHGMIRREVLCAKCAAHLGHVFSDGPPPTGLRYCINSAALQFASKEEPKEKP